MDNATFKAECARDLATEIASIKARIECYRCMDTIGPFREILGDYYCVLCLREQAREDEDGQREVDNDRSD